MREASVRYGASLALDNVSLDIAAGEIVCLVGPNGAGKSTLFGAVAGGLPVKGEILIAGKPAGTVEARHAIGLGTQRASLFDHLTGAENLKCFGRIAGLKPAAIAARTEELTAKLSLGDFIHRQCRYLSGGMRQRLSIACALVHEPALVMLDEPAASLDPESIADLNRLIRALANEGLAVLCITHDMTQAEEIADRVAVLIAGRLAAIGAPQTLIEQYATDGVEIIVEASENADFKSAGFTRTSSTKWRRLSPSLHGAAQLIGRLGEAALSVEINRPGLGEVIAKLGPAPVNERQSA
jgi:ABC-2 type transport system ATP-binding protein